ncbi:MAG: ABC transporter substrate-binding protein [Bdellovibrionales bacterium]|nr:ABC transporter substrate-binding protein [Bdellovibrionales bacterium]
MRTIVLCVSLLFSSVVYAGPVESVGVAIGKVLQVMQNPSDSARATGLCQLARTYVDSQTIGADLLGRQYMTLPNDQDGVRQFMALVPSIIVSEFYDRLDGLGTEYTVNPNLIPKGSSRVGVQVTVGSKRLTVTANRGNNKVLDVEYMGISMVNNKRFEYQRDLQRWLGGGNPKPVTQLVNSLINSRALIRCN